jgi:hypothetical protein
LLLSPAAERVSESEHDAFGNGDALDEQEGTIGAEDRLVDQFGQLRFDPTGERRRFGAPASGGRPGPVFRHDAPASTIELSFESSR